MTQTMQSPGWAPSAAAEAEPLAPEADRPEQDQGQHELPTLVDGMFLDAYPSRRFQSAWMGIIVHSGQSVVLVGLVLALVLA